MKFNKLVRDKIPKIIKENGNAPVTHVADDREYWKRLKEKLTEEVAEFRKDGSMEELADVIEVIRAICDFREIDLDELEEVRAEKERERGNFSGRVVLDERKSD